MICPFCTSPDVERDGFRWFCRCCARVFRAYTAKDAVILQVLGIRNPEAPDPAP